ncbi:MAG: chemotaxis protein CheX [Proteobacteria bacterium]|nr:chemotaxis protein CheX [Pseudomonadota bacterium]
MTTEPKYDVNLIKTFVEGTVDTLKVQCSIAATVGKPYKLSDGVKSLGVDIIGIIGLTCKSFKGTMAICFPTKTYLGVMSGMLGETYTEMNSDIQDGAGELLNIIFGYTKRILNQQGYEIEMAIPSVIYGANIEVQADAKTTSVFVPLSTPSGDFYVKVAVK